jgi:hypothetical protein
VACGCKGWSVAGGASNGDARKVRGRAAQQPQLSAASHRLARPHNHTVWLDHDEAELLPCQASRAAVSQRGGRKACTAAHQMRAWSAGQRQWLVPPVRCEQHTSAVRASALVTHQAWLPRPPSAWLLPWRRATGHGGRQRRPTWRASAGRRPPRARLRCVSVRTQRECSVMCSCEAR